jgi:hypothetical protein
MGPDLGGRKQLQIVLYDSKDSTRSVSHHADGGGSNDGSVEKSAMACTDYQQIAWKLCRRGDDLVRRVSCAGQLLNLAAGVSFSGNPGTQVFDSVFAAWFSYVERSQFRTQALGKRNGVAQRAARQFSVVDWAYDIANCSRR